MRRILLLFFLSGLALQSVKAQNLYTRFERLTVNEGLSSNRIRCIFRDSRDYLWMGTNVGLDRFDSYQVKRYRRNENLKGSISSDILTCIFEDHNKNLWFGTYDGLNLYDPQKDNFRVFRRDKYDANSLNGNIITGIVEDKKGNIWVVTDGSCLNRWDSVIQGFIKYPFETKNLVSSVRLSKMASVDSKGNIWIGSMRPGITCFNPESGEFTTFNDPYSKTDEFFYKTLYIDNKDKIWIATDGNGFLSYDPEVNKFRHFGVSEDGKGTNLDFIFDIIPEDERYLLLAVDQGGINRFDKMSERFEYIKYESTNVNGLTSNGIWCFFRDREGILWIGTSGGGINYFNKKSGRFKLFTHNNVNQNSLSYDFASVFFEDHDGLIWIGTDGGGLNVFDPKTGNFRVFKHDPRNPSSISGNVIRGIAEDSDQNIWVGTWEAGLNKYDRKSGKFIHFMPDKENPSAISCKTIWNLMIDHNNIIWISLFRNGIDLFDTKKGVIKRFRPDPMSKGSLSAKNCWFILEDKTNKIWISTQNGLNLYDSQTETFKVFNFPGNNLGSFFIDKSGYLWVGSYSRGLFQCNKDGTILKNYNNSNILPDNNVHAITQDSKGYIWISTNSGISRLNTDIQKIRNYTKADGLQGDQFYQQAFLRTRSGDMYFGGYGGFNFFHPDSLKDNDFLPHVYITDLQIFNKPVLFAVPGSQFQTHISEAKEIVLKSEQSVFSLSFVAINYTHPGKNQYKYMLAGFEKEWNYTDGSRRFVTYTNLDHGEYTFMVTSTNNDGIWSDKGVSLKIIILPPWFKTWWFRVILALMVIFMFAVILMLRTRKLKRQKELLEEIVEIKTAELKELNASKDKFFSIIAHDLKNPFNTIVGFSDIMKESIRLNDPATFMKYTTMINTSAVQTLQLLENLLEWANIQGGKLSFNPVPLKLSELIKNEYSTIEGMAISKNINFTSYVDDDLRVIADTNMLKTIVRNLITNAVKFTSRGGQIIVNALITSKNVEISFSDNGLGMTPETIATLFRIDTDYITIGTENEKGTGLGLFLCKEFVEKNGGRIWAESSPGNGTSLKFILPLYEKKCDFQTEQ